jgi:hypothetical protein
MARALKGVHPYAFDGLLKPLDDGGRSHENFAAAKEQRGLRQGRYQLQLRSDMSASNGGCDEPRPHCSAVRPEPTRMASYLWAASRLEKNRS